MYLAIQTQTQGNQSGFLTSPFLVALVLLGGAAGLVGPVARSMNFRQAKTAIPLKKPLSAMAVDGLMPFRVVERHILESVVVEALGTDHYLNWTLEDTSAPTIDPLRYAQLFITYDTGGQNLVPHTPDECRLGAGYEPAKPHENTDVKLSPLGSGPTDVPVRVCTFVKTAVFNREEVTVVYTFHCNGEFAATREGVRLLFNDPRDRHGYFSKIEISFPRATREQSMQGAARLLNRLLPVLLRDHWPDFAAAEAAARKPNAAP